MKIIYVNDAFAIWGGIERILVEKANYLAEVYGYEVYLVTANQGSHPMPFPLNSKVKYQDLGICFQQQYQYKLFRRLLTRWQLNRLFVKRLRDYFQRVDPDLIITARSWLMSFLVSTKVNVPIIFESHSTRSSLRFENSSWYKQRRAEDYNRSVRYAKLVVALTEGDAHDWQEVNPNVCVIPNIVHLNESGSYSSCSQKSVIFVGRFSRQKDVRSLLKVWSLVHRRYPDWQLQIYGGYGEEKDVLLPEIEKNQENIVVYEPTPEILCKYLENSMLIMTSRYESFGLVLPEAMSCGLPVVAFDCPYGPAEIITDNVDGFLIKGWNIEAFAEKVCQLMESESLRQSMGAAAIVSSQRYKADLIMPRWKLLFEEIVGKSE